MEARQGEKQSVTDFHNYMTTKLEASATGSPAVSSQRPKRRMWCALIIGKQAIFALTIGPPKIRKGLLLL